MTEDILGKIALCVEFGKVNIASVYPPDMKGKPGTAEYVAQALEAGIVPDEILQKSFIPAMGNVGRKFTEHKIFVPQMLMSAKAMSTGMELLRPFFRSGEISYKGKFIIGTVAGDVHDIGKNLVAMMIEGAGWEVVDLGVDVSADRFVSEAEKAPGCYVGLSAMLTTTMLSMQETVKAIKEKLEHTMVCIGGAPVTQHFCTQIAADFYSPHPQELIEFLNAKTIK